MFKTLNYPFICLPVAGNSGQGENAGRHSNRGNEITDFAIRFSKLPISDQQHSLRTKRTHKHEYYNQYEGAAYGND